MRRLLVAATTALALVAPAAHADGRLGVNDDPDTCVDGGPAGEACVYGLCQDALQPSDPAAYVHCTVDGLLHGVSGSARR